MKKRTKNTKAQAVGKTVVGDRPAAPAPLAPTPSSVALLCVEGWGGRREYRVELLEILGAECLILAMQQTPVPGHSMWLNPGETALVPSYSLRMEPLNTQGQLTGAARPQP